VASIAQDDWLRPSTACCHTGWCEFDLPSYHYWLHQPAEERMQHATLAGTLRPFWAAVDIVLGLLRDSGSPKCSM
jgi:cell division protein ZapD